jgi:hypothetical protein
MLSGNRRRQPVQPFPDAGKLSLSDARLTADGGKRDDRLGKGQPDKQTAS